MTPQITPEDSVIMDLDISKDSRGVTTLAGPVINTACQNPGAGGERGGTVVIGRHLHAEDTTDINKGTLLGMCR